MYARFFETFDFYKKIAVSTCVRCNPMVLFIPIKIQSFRKFKCLDKLHAFRKLVVLKSV